MTVQDALATWQRGNRSAAVGHLQELLERHPESTEARLTLADMRADLGDYVRAIALYDEVLEAEPGHWRGRLGIARCLRSKPVSVLRLSRPERLLECLQDPDLEPEMVAQACVVLLLRNPRLQPLWFGAPLEADLDDPLLLQCLPLVIMADLRIEQGLTRLRKELLRDSRLGARRQLAAALALQCSLNEFAWWVDEEEQQWLAAASADTPEGALALALYGRLRQRPGSSWPELEAVFYRQLEVPARERELAQNVKTLRPIRNDVSLAVSSLYEENPYPRWRGLSRRTALEPSTVLSLQFPHWIPTANLRQPEVLMAGCGTGRDLLTIANGWKCARLTGVDLSRTSLAYAQSMAAQLGFSEIEFAQADLLTLTDWEREFDLIFCTGVLHHMADPLAGWRVLCRLLRPGGMMKIALYSELGRQGIVAGQRWLAEQAVELHQGRYLLQQLPLDHPARAAMETRDFFYLSGCRDLLYHVQEHRFRIPQIGAALQELGLELVGFEVRPEVRLEYEALFPEDRQRTNLVYWEKFEELNPQTFFAMYQFWCQKPGNGLLDTKS